MSNSSDISDKSASKSSGDGSSMTTTSNTNSNNSGSNVETPYYCTKQNITGLSTLRIRASVDLLNTIIEMHNPIEEEENDDDNTGCLLGNFRHFYQTEMLKIVL